MSLDFYFFTSFYFIYVCSDSWVSLDLYVSIKTTTTTTTTMEDASTGVLEKIKNI